MSTRIYAGFRMKGTWEELAAELISYRKHVKRLYLRDSQSLIVEMAIQAFDERLVGLSDSEGRSPVKSAVDEFRGIEKENPTKVTMSLHPKGRHIYGISFARAQYAELWLNRDRIEPWGYWNNSDRPDEVSAREWSHRRKTWDTILGNNAPSEVGFLADCLHSHTVYDALKPTWRSIRPHLPLFEKRVHHIASRRVCDLFLASHSWLEWLPWATSDEGKASIEAECEAVRLLLPEKIEQHHLFG